jgi:hypothetical protein
MAKAEAVGVEVGGGTVLEAVEDAQPVEVEADVA